MPAMLVQTLVFALVSLAIFYIVGYLEHSGSFSHYYKHRPGTCKHVKGHQLGSEDFFTTSTGLTFITSGVSHGPASQGFLHFLKNHNIKGKIFTFDFTKPDDPLTELRIRNTDHFKFETFRPHGISLLEDKTNGDHLVYVINHPYKELDRVDKFIYKPKTKELQHLTTFYSDEFRSINNLAVVSEDVFYISNYNYFTNHMMATLESLLPVKVSTLVLFDGTDGVVAASGLHGPNGVVVSEDGRFVYVSLTPDKQLHVYSRDLEDNSLTLTQISDLHMFPDNILLSQAGDALYIGCHVRSGEIAKLLENPETRTSSSVLHVPLKDGLVDVLEISEIFHDHGHLISGSSVAMRYNQHLLIGSVLDSLLVCHLNKLVKREQPMTLNRG